MNTKLQELTDKIYTEGVEKGKSEAADIISNAESEANKIITSANKKAEEILKKAHQDAEELDKNTRSELKLFANQAVNSLKTDVTNLICDKIVSDSVKAATSDKAFMQQIISKFVDELSKQGAVTIEAKDADDLQRYFESQAKELLNQGVTIVPSKGKSEFSIQPANGSYKVSFGDAEFIAYFKEFLRPQLIEMLF